MNVTKLTIFLFFIISLTVSCNNNKAKKTDNTPSETTQFEVEKTAILAVINNETKAAFNRDYEGWKEKWVQEPYVTKTYMEFPDSSMTETLGWKNIDNFVRTYIEEHPTPSPLPTMVKDINVRLYGSGAWVSYEQTDIERGFKRETRLMEKINGQWKIAGMHTTIYGFQDNKPQ